MPACNTHRVCLIGDMKIKDLLEEKETEILNKWKEVVLGRYEAETVRIFMDQQDQFANPLGYKTSAGLKELYRVICDESDREIETPALGQLIKLMAVQEISPSQALGFVFTLKEIIRKIARNRKISEVEWESFDARVDQAALALFDLYSNSREKLNQVRFNDFKTGRNALTPEVVCPSASINDE